MNIMSVNLELFIREFYMLAYTKHSPGLARNLNYLISKYDIKDIDICIRKSLKEAYIDNMSPLSIIVYENIVKHLVKEAISGNVDRLIGIHSKLILGKIIPIMEYFNPTK